VLLENEPAWRSFFAEVRAFLSAPTHTPSSKHAHQNVGLTRSEHEVLRLIARGLDNEAIAKALSKSEKTVRNQVTSIFAKLGVTTLARAVAFARDAGIGEAE
jgi:DNA-binding NarL/FixJ family response regulator